MWTENKRHVHQRQSIIKTYNKCAESVSHCLLDPRQIEIYHISDYSCNIFFFILHSILYTGNEFNQFLLPLFFINDYLWIPLIIHLRSFHSDYY